MKRPVIIAGVILILCLCGWWLTHKPAIPAHGEAGDIGASRWSLAGLMPGAYSTRITFYGRVLDQHGAPVAGAVVRGAVATSMAGDSAKTTTTADAAGNFTLHSRGMSLFVTVDKPGHYHLFPEQLPGLVSEMGFDYGSDLGQGIHQPDPARPVILHLYKPGTLEPLTRLPSRSHRMHRSGEALEVALDPGQGGRHRITLSCRAVDDVTPEGQFTWRFQVRVIAGGLQPCAGAFHFEAPAAGYQEADAVDMPSTLPRDQWADSVRRSYFVRFDDGTHARIKVEMIAFGDYFTVVEGHHNPKAGSRNLEAAPSQR